MGGGRKGGAWGGVGGGVQGGGPHLSLPFCSELGPRLARSRRGELRLRVVPVESTLFCGTLGGGEVGGGRAVVPPK